MSIVFLLNVALVITFIGPSSEEIDWTYVIAFKIILKDIFVHKLATIVRIQCLQGKWQALLNRP